MLRSRQTLLCLTAIFLAACSSDSIHEKVLNELDEVLKKNETYDNYFRQRADVLKQLKGKDTEPAHAYEINRKLAEEYEAYSLDSTLFYLSENQKIAGMLGDPEKKIETDLLIAHEYIMTGYHIEASDILTTYSKVKIPEHLRILYFDVCHTFAGELMSYYQNKAVQHDMYIQRVSYRDSLLKYVEPQSFKYYELMSELAMDNGDRELRLSYLDSMVFVSPLNSHDYAKACYFYSIAMESDKEKLNWMAKSAIADIMCATKDYASLIDLSRLLFEIGDVDRAFHYTADFCLPDALFFNGKLRPWQIVRFFPELEKAYVEKAGRQKNIMKVSVVVTSALLALLVFVTAVLIRRHRILVRTRAKLEESYSEIERRNIELENINSRLHKLNESLKETDTVKQEYIALFLSILSENINENRQYKNHVLKYIRRGNEKYLADEIEALPPIDDDIQRFYKMFDETFVKLYPGFVEKFNELLVEGEAIFPKGNDILSPELRIFALIKLGINDSSKIASLLHYSSNTIYNYRAKIKNKAKGDRDRFEEAVKAIV